MLIERTYDRVERSLKARHSVLVLGPRGTGKTFYLSKLVQSQKRTRFIDLLDSVQYRKYFLEPSLLYDELKVAVGTSTDSLYVMIDEVQLVPRLLFEVHRCIDAMKGKLVFILTGSSARKLKRENADLLASRAISIPFFPLSSKEIDFNSQFSMVMRFGSMPEIITVDDDWLRQDKLTSYVGTYLDEEIKKESELRHLEGFHRFLELAAAHNGEPVNYAKIGRAAGISPPTVREYFSILVDTLVATEIPAWTHSIKKQLQQASKYYLFDNGVLNALTGELAAEARPSTYRFGRLFENLVVNEIIRHRAMESKKASLFHYREQSGNEIDLILQKSPVSQPVAIEIKSEIHPTPSDVPTLVKFLSENPKAHGLVLCRATHAYEKNGVRFEPYLAGIQTAFDAL